MTRTLPSPPRREAKTVPTVSTVKMTAQQFIQMGEDPEGVRLELVNGEIAVSASPVPRHSYAIMQLAIMLGNHINEHDLGELYSDVDTILDEYNVRRPDLLFFRRDRLEHIGEKAMLGPPDLAVEVISDSSAKIDRVDKFEQYAAAGVSHYWIIDPMAHSFDAFRLESGTFSRVTQGKEDEQVSAPPFSDLRVPLSRLWRR
jgi:Uma2 family endonuclease